MFAVWLPLFWLAAMAYGSVAAPDSGPSLGDRTSISTTRHNRHDSSRDVQASKQALRHLNRRAGISCDSDGKALPAPAAATAFTGLKPAPNLFSVVEAPANLLRGWQFNLRTAPEPRAPSTVS